MKRSIRAIINVLLTCSFLLCIILPFTVPNAHAGLVEMQIWNKEMYESGFQGGSLYYTGNISNSGGKIVFDEDTTSDARIVSKYRVYNIEGKTRKCGFTAGLNIGISQISTEEDNMFGFVFGLAYSGASVQSKNSAFVYFTEVEGELYLGLNKYNNSAIPESCISPISIEDKMVTDREGLFRLGVIVDDKGGIKILIDDNLLVEKADANLSFDGYIGIGQTQQNLWQVDNFIVTGTSNHVPSTTDVSESFYDDKFNSNAIYTYAYVNYEDDCHLKPINERLEFKNISTAYLTTLYKYSNYELTFDITDIQRTAEYDSDFTVLKPVSNKISISLYSDDPKVLTNKGLTLEIRPEDWSNTTEAKSTKVVLLKDGVELYSKTMEEDFHLWDKDFAGTIFNVKIVMTDGVLSMNLKQSDRVGYTEVVSYDFGNAGQGHVKIFATGTSKAMAVKSNLAEAIVCNFTIDNFSIINNDYSKGSDIYVDYQSSKILPSKDYDYVDTWDKNDLLFGGNK